MIRQRSIWSPADTTTNRRGGRDFAPRCLSERTYVISISQPHLSVKGMMRSLANVHCEPFVPPPNGVVPFSDVS